MASLREGSRGEEVTAMGGWQWGRRGWRDGEDRFFTTLRSVQNDMLGCEGGWVPAYARTTGGGGFPLPSLRGRVLCGGMGMGSRFRLCEGGFSAEGRGWVPAYARTTKGGMGPRPPAFAGAGSRREDTGAWGRGTGGSRTSPTEGEYCRALGSPPSPVFTRAGSNLPP